MPEDDYAIIENNRQTCFWVNTYGIVPHLARLIDAKHVLEIGVAYGYHADFILSVLPDISCTGIDPYPAGYDPSDIFCKDVQKLLNDPSEQNASIVCIKWWS
jgi:hypothetical protein